MKCVTGCKNYTGGEIYHHKDCPFYPDKDCPFYPESMSRLFDETKIKLEQKEKQIDDLETKVTWYRPLSKALLKVLNDTQKQNKELFEVLKEIRE